ncbi:MAG: YhfC family intramembrane metalloprotease [Firmicutes bacterium]|nr:YhfC family intramembrane metalloprotease [Bacillota bacterium]
MAWWLLGAGLFAIALPFLGFALLGRRWRLSWRAFGIGAATFFVAQVVLRLPWIGPLTAWLQRHGASTPPAALGVVLLAAVTAGLFEEGARYLAYRLALPRPRPGEALAMGLGHGGLESILLVGLNGVVTAALLLVLAAHPSALPAALAEQLRRGVAPALAGGPALPLLGALERLSALALQVALSVVVAVAVLRRSFALWLGAFGVHTGVDALAGFLPLWTRSLPLTEAAVLAAALLAAAWALRLLRSDAWPGSGEEAPAATGPAGTS